MRALTIAATSVLVGWLRPEGAASELPAERRGVVGPVWRIALGMLLLAACATDQEAREIPECTNSCAASRDANAICVLVPTEATNKYCCECVAPRAEPLGGSGGQGPDRATDGLPDAGGVGDADLLEVGGEVDAGSQGDADGGGETGADRDAGAAEMLDR